MEFKDKGEANYHKKGQQALFNQRNKCNKKKSEKTRAAILT